LQWKNRYFDIKDAKQEYVDASGSQPSSISTECDICFGSTRLKITFDQTKNDLRIFGFTITNPTQAQINLEWLKPLALQLILTKSDDGAYKVYLDSKNSDFVPVELMLKIDPSVLSKKWYEKINMMANLGLGSTLIGQSSLGGLVSAGVGYLITPKINVGLRTNGIIQ